MPRPARPGPGVLLALSLIAGCASNGPDPAADDAELVAAQARVDDASNGFLRLEEAAAELSWSQEDEDRLNSLGEDGSWDAEFVANGVGLDDPGVEMHGLRGRSSPPPESSPRCA